MDLLGPVSPIWKTCFAVLLSNQRHKWQLHVSNCGAMEQTIHDLLKCIGEVVPNSKSFAPTSVRLHQSSEGEHWEGKHKRESTVCHCAHTHTNSHRHTHRGRHFWGDGRWGGNCVGKLLVWARHLHHAWWAVIGHCLSQKLMGTASARKFRKSRLLRKLLGTAYLPTWRSFKFWPANTPPHWVENFSFEAWRAEWTAATSCSWAGFWKCELETHLWIARSVSFQSLSESWWLSVTGKVEQAVLIISPTLTSAFTSFFVPTCGRVMVFLLVTCKDAGKTLFQCQWNSTTAINCCRIRSGSLHIIISQGRLNTGW